MSAAKAMFGKGDRVQDRRTGKCGSVQWLDGDKQGVVLVLFDDAAAHIVHSRDLDHSEALAALSKPSSRNGDAA